MPVIVATHSSLPEAEFPVISFGSSVDSGYIMESVLYFCGSEPRFCTTWEYPGRPAKAEDFNIGSCLFLKKDGTWYYNDGSKEKPNLLPVVYGQKALEAYGSGEMFAPLEKMFGGD